MNGRTLGREIARAVSGQMLRDDLNRAAAAHVARLSCVSMVDMLVESGHDLWPRVSGRFATGGVIKSADAFFPDGAGREYMVPKS